MDMLRFDEFTIGFAWRSDYGSSRASKEQFRTLRAYSPVSRLFMSCTHAYGYHLFRVLFRSN